MIDPKALHAHFKNVNQRHKPPEDLIPRVPDIKPLTGIEPITITPEESKPQIIQPIIDTTKLQEELKEVTEALATLKQSLSEAAKIETVTVPVTVAIEQTIPVQVSEPVEEPEEEYNPYGYYSGPKF